MLSVSEVALRLHCCMNHAPDSDTSLDLRIEDDVATVLESMITGANMVDTASDFWHFSRAKEATFKAKEVVVGLIFTKLTIRINVNVR